ncbi:solute carrier family 35 member G1-like [Argiope bruennichi]|uniref:solute carrier family 35 member G1-like n=1 Tax=Argiope bruennichi TaxID=94029 RepID=UPI0024943C34|nr:solute carrier family 35 member G1-like [Argiope bruennichi]
MHTRRRSYHLWPKISKGNKEEKKRKWAALKGLFFAIISAFCTLLSAIIVKKVSLHPVQSAFYRFVGSLALSIPAVVKSNETPAGPKGFRLILLFAGIFGAGSMLFAFLAYRYLPLYEIFVIFGTTPIFVTVAAHLFLKEYCDIFHSVLLIFSVIGIVFSSKLPSHIIAKDITYSTDNIYGFLAAIAAVLCRTGQMIFIKKAKEVPHSIAIFACCWTGVIESSMLMPAFTEMKLHRCGLEWINIVLIGFLSFFDQAFMTIALQCEFVSLVATVRCAINITMGFLIEAFLFHDEIDYFVIIGAVLVVSSIVSLGLRKWMSST